MITQDDINGFKTTVVKDSIKIIEIVEHEDGSAYLSMEMDSSTYSKIFGVGFNELIMRGLSDDNKK